MLDPLTFTLKMQQAAASAACCATGLMAANWVHLFGSGQDAIAMPGHRRSEELHAHQDCIATGATWSDHYGKRSHDVDVEHMR
ncbi:MAG: hypothetical protein ACFCUO_13380 [Rhodospirillales bacterium]